MQCLCSSIRLASLKADVLYHSYRDYEFNDMTPKISRLSLPALHSGKRVQLSPKNACSLIFFMSSTTTSTQIISNMGPLPYFLS